MSKWGGFIPDRGGLTEKDLEKAVRHEKNRKKLADQRKKDAAAAKKDKK